MSAPVVSATSAFASFFFFYSRDLASDIPAHFLALTLPQLASISNDLGAFTLAHASRATRYRQGPLTTIGANQLSQVHRLCFRAFDNFFFFNKWIQSMRTIGAIRLFFYYNLKFEYSAALWDNRQRCSNFNFLGLSMKMVPKKCVMTTQYYHNQFTLFHNFLRPGFPVTRHLLRAFVTNKVNPRLPYFSQKRLVINLPNLAHC